MALTIGATSRRTGVHIETIRYYEREGLIPEPVRSQGGHRLFGPADIERLGFIRRARELGFSLEEVRQLLAISGGNRRCGEVRQLAEHHLAEVREKIADLGRLQRSLTRLVQQCGETPDDECPVIDALRLGRSGAVGPG